MAVVLADEQTWWNANSVAQTQKMGIYDWVFTVTLDGTRGVNNPSSISNRGTKTATIIIGVDTSKSRGHWMRYLRREMIKIAKSTGANQTIPTRMFPPKPLSVVEASPASFTLAFEDHFTSLNRAIWALWMHWDHYRGQNDNQTDVNGEEQHYAHDGRHLRCLPGGGLVITCERTPVVTPAKTYKFDSAMIASHPGFTFKKGYVEARVKFPPGHGIFPAVWEYDADGTGAGYAQEIDNFEGIGQFKTGHSGGAFLPNGDTIATFFSDIGADITDDFHVVGLNWNDSTLDYYLDNVLVGSMSAAGMTHNMYLILNFAVGSTLTGPVPDEVTFPLDFIVDYIKVWSPAA